MRRNESEDSTSIPANHEGKPAAAENERMHAEASSLLLGLAERIGVCWPEVDLGNVYTAS
jgi:hypothetical protein